MKFVKQTVFFSIAKVSTIALAKLGNILSQRRPNETDEQRMKLLKILKVPKDCYPSILEYKIVIGLNELVSTKDGSSFALHEMLESVSLDYAATFRQCFV